MNYGILRNKLKRSRMPKKKNKSIPFNEKHKYKKWTSDQGYNFWAKDEEDAKLYLEKTEGNLGSLKEVKDV